MVINMELENVFDNAEKINVYNDGAVNVYGNGEKAFDEILVGWKAMIDGAHEMPAFGVSIGRLTRQEMQKGVWTEFVFDREYEHNGMPFEKLLINVKKDYYGFNLVRYTAEHGYEGRCFYYDLVGKNMGNFYNILLNL